MHKMSLNNFKDLEAFNLVKRQRTIFENRINQLTYFIQRTQKL